MVMVIFFIKISLVDFKVWGLGCIVFLKEAGLLHRSQTPIPKIYKYLMVSLKIKYLTFLIIIVGPTLHLL